MTKKLPEMKYTTRDLWEAAEKLGLSMVVFGGQRDRDGVTIFTRDVQNILLGYRVECPDYAPSTVVEERDDLCRECGRCDCDRSRLNVIERVAILEAPKL